MGHILRTFATLNSSIYSIKAKNPTHNFWAVYPFEWRRLIRFSSIFFFFLAGPSFWGLINPQWNMCNKGRRQSPIDVVPDKLLFDPYLRPLHIDKHKVRRGHEVMRCSTTSFHPPPPGETLNLTRMSWISHLHCRFPALCTTRASRWSSAWTRTPSSTWTYPVDRWPTATSSRRSTYIMAPRMFADPSTSSRAIAFPARLVLQGHIQML